jgi:membrane-associated protease RseP (regulator of RpoE activity)
MLKTTLLVVAGLVAGLAMAFWLRPNPEPIDQRATLEELGESPVGAPRARDNARNNARNRPVPAAEGFIDYGRRAAAATPERLVIDLIVAGFAPARAEWINRRVQELRMQAMQAEDEARREGRAPPPDLEATTLRTELGDEDYERFLTAQDRPTRIKVIRVLARSPAERAGLRQGDEIFAYDGTRVFDIQQLNELALRGTRGEPVVVGVRRNGENFGFALPKGPTGILSGGDSRGPAPAVQR